MSAFDPCICLYVLVKLVFNFINSTGAYGYIKRNACTGIRLPIETRMKVSMSLEGVEAVYLSEENINVNCDVFDDFVRTTPSLVVLNETVIIFPLVTSRDNSTRDIHVTHMKQNVV